VTNTAGGDALLASGGNQSKGTAAVHGQSGSGNAIEGYSTANPASGVFGQDNNANSYGRRGTFEQRWSGSLATAPTAGRCRRSAIRPRPAIGAAS